MRDFNESDELLMYFMNDLYRISLQQQVLCDHLVRLGKCTDLLMVDE